MTTRSLYGTKELSIGNIRIRFWWFLTGATFHVTLHIIYMYIWIVIIMCIKYSYLRFYCGDRQRRRLLLNFISRCFFFCSHHYQSAAPHTHTYDQRPHLLHFRVTIMELSKVSTQSTMEYYSNIANFMRKYHLTIRWIYIGWVYADQTNKTYITITTAVSSSSLLLWGYYVVSSMHLYMK